MEAEKMKSREHKIVVAVDESEESMHALSWCLGNLSTYMFSSDVVGSIEKYGTEMVNSVMQRAEAVYRNFQTNAHIMRVVGKGDPKNVICNTVEKLKADTLVMGSHGYGFFKRTILGSVSDYCAKHVECPVVIVKKS
ncbi:hypothetical protein C1H46_034352 [Malus baccata]|uniref:UspA domain-containing protein n=1 Tax=Malus baccata TaxID=106549 RepID=A0A540L0R3_MALBA|nr:hypothetical protein C1H46_034352 [Malus baccata]